MKITEREQEFTPTYVSTCSKNRILYRLVPTSHEAAPVQVHECVREAVLPTWRNFHQNCVTVLVLLAVGPIGRNTFGLSV